MKRLFIGAMMIAVLSFAGCKTMSDPVAAAQTTEQQAYALYGTFVIYEEVGASIAVDPATPDALRSLIKRVDAVAKPAADAMLGGARDFVKAKALVDQGQSTEEKVTITSANLVNWVADAKPKILALQCAVNPKQKVCSGVQP